MENLINNIGGYDSWQFTVLAFGLLAIGLALRIKWIFTIPIPFAGLILLYFYIGHTYQAQRSSISDPITLGIASTLPILFLAIGSLTIVDPSSVGRIFGLSKPKTGKPNETK